MSTTNKAGRSGHIFQQPVAEPQVGCHLPARQPDRLPAPKGSTAESVLAQPGLDRFVLDLHAKQPEPVRRWLTSPTAIRVIGPRYDPDDDTAHRMAGGSLADWFDVVAFVRRIAPVHNLGLGPTASPRRGRRPSRRS